MRYAKSCALLALVLVASYVVTADEAPAASNENNPPGSITFVARNFAAVEGVFHKWQVTKAHFDPENLSESTVDIEVDVASIDTGNKKRDKHLRNEDFFDVPKYPTAKIYVHDIQSTDRRVDGNAVYTAKLDIDLHGVKKTVAVNFELESTSPSMIKGSFEIRRRDWEIGGPYRRINPLSVREKVAISFSATLPKDIALDDK